MKACIYYKPTEYQSFEEIKTEVDQLKKEFEDTYEIARIIIENDDYNQLIFLVNKDLEQFDTLILNKEIEDEFYALILTDLVLQQRIKIIVVT